MEGDRQALQVREQVAAHIGLHAQCGAGHGVAADKEQHRFGDAEGQREPGERPDGGRVVLADRPVDDAADDERDQCLREHRTARSDDHDDDCFAVRTGPPPEPQERFDCTGPGGV